MVTAIFPGLPSTRVVSVLTWISTCLKSRFFTISLVSGSSWEERRIVTYENDPVPMAEKKWRTRSRCSLRQG